MKRMLSLFLIVIFVIIMSGCSDGCGSGTLKIVLNGEELDVYTMHYGIFEEFVSIPLDAFLLSLGAERLDPPENNGYNTERYSLAGNRYVFVPSLHLFILEADYYALIDRLKGEGKQLSQLSSMDASAYGLLPLSESKFYVNESNRVVYITDHITLMNALKESGIDITIEYDYSKKILDVILISSED